MTESDIGHLRIMLQNRTITCSKCGRLDMFTTESFEDMKDVAECQGWRVCRIVSYCEVRGLCPSCVKVV